MMDMINFLKVMGIYRGTKYHERYDYQPKQFKPFFPRQQDFSLTDFASSLIA